MTTLTLARRGLALCFVLALPLSAAAQQQHLQDYRALISKSGVMTPIGPRMFGDEQNLYTGTTQFVVTDVSLPGNDGLPVAVTRRYVAEPQQIANKAFGDWELDLPRITAVVSRQTGWQVTPTQSGHTATDRCRSFGSPVPVTSAGTTYQPNEYWQGYQLIMPGEQPRALVNRASSNTAQPGTVVTSDWWRVNCVTLTAGGPGEGFEAVSPDGTRYLFERLTDRTYSSLTRPGGSLAVFDSSSKSDDDSKERAIDTLDRTEVVLPITRVTDRYGNSVSYHYGPCSPALPTCARLTSISASDNRHLSIGYVNGRISTVSDNTGRTWTYSYRGAGTNVLEGSLIDVNLPDGTDWTIDLQDIGRMSWTYPTQDAQCNLGNPIYVGGQAPPRIGTIGHPSGATATFTFRVIRHGRNGTPANDCQTSGTVAIASYHARVWDQLTLTEKSISNLGDWNFGYTPCSSFCSSRKTVHVTDPRGYVTSYTYGNTWNGDEGLLESIGEGGQSGQTPLRIETFRYFPASSSGNSYPEQIGVSAQDRGDRVRKIYVRPLSSHTICQQRMAFRRSESNLDSYGNPQRIVRSNGSISDFQFNANDCAAVTLTTRKDETLQFNNDASSNWVIGTFKKSTDGLVELEYTLDSESRITQIRRFNKLQTTLTYHSGTPLVHTAKDGLNNTTTLTSYHRGIPRRIDYADGGFITAVVSDRGLITQVTDEEGRATAYEYDSDNSLLKKVTPPGAGSTVTNIAYTPPAGTTAEVLAGDALGPTTLLVAAAAANAVRRTFTASDPLVTDLANKIETAYPGHVVGVEVPYYRANGELATDADILLKNGVVEVKSGGGKGMTTQLKRVEEATGLPTIGYGPDLKPSILRSCVATNCEQSLIEVVRPD